MYRQIKVHPSDRDLQRILWRYSFEEPIQEYQLNTQHMGQLQLHIWQHAASKNLQMTMSVITQEQLK
jgi:hypothetical protein